MKAKYLLIIAAFVLSIILAAGCSSYSSTATSSAPATQTSSAPAPSNQVAVNIAGFAFSPSPLTVSKGATVTWTNNDSTAHTGHQRYRCLG